MAYDQYFQLITRYPDNYAVFIEKCKEQGLTVLTTNEYKSKVGQILPAKVRQELQRRQQVVKKKCCGGGAIK